VIEKQTIRKKLTTYDKYANINNATNKYFTEESQHEADGFVRCGDREADSDGDNL
jgi:hypothetical protein